MTEQDRLDLELGRLVRQMPLGWALHHDPQDTWSVTAIAADGDGAEEWPGLDATPEGALREALSGAVGGGITPGAD